VQLDAGDRVVPPRPRGDVGLHAPDLGEWRAHEGVRLGDYRRGARDVHGG
jgi:hypothetical protein